jgi:predicted PurR-regulated permease PerM
MPETEILTKTEPRSGRPRETAREPERAEPPQGQTRARLLAVTATVLVLAFLKWSQPATMPLAFAVFLIALAWPLQEHLEHRLPRWAAFTLTVVAILLVLAAFVGSLWWSSHLVAEKSPQYTDRVEQLYQRFQTWLQSYGMSLPQGGSGTGSVLGGGLARTVLGGAASSVSFLALVLALTILGLFEVRDFRERAARAFRQEHHGRELIESVRQIAIKYQRYLWALFVTAVLQGVTVYLLALAVGLDFAFVWALMAFLLNFLPTVGSTIAVIPPTLFALLQFDGFGRPLAVFLGMTALQLIMGNYVDPLIQGRFVALSPVMVLTSIVFWGWIWGVPGALLGVPITVGIVVATDHFPKTRWIARLLSSEPRRRPAKLEA